MTTTLKQKDGVPLCLITTGMPFGRRCMKASKEKAGKNCVIRTKKRAGLWV